MLDIAPGRSAIGIAEHALDKDRVRVVKLISQGAEIIADQPILKRAHPGGVNQRLGQVFVHLAVPLCQKRQRALAQALWCALGGGLAGEPQIGTDQWQKRAGGKAYVVKLGLDKAVAGMHLAVLHQASPAVHALRVAPKKAHVQREGPVNHLVVGVAEDSALRCNEFGVGGIGQHPLPAVFRQPATAWHSALTFVTRIAARHGADGFKSDHVLINKRQVLRGRHEKSPGLDPLIHRLRPHQRHCGCHRCVLRAQRGPAQGCDMTRGGDLGEVIVAAG